MAVKERIKAALAHGDITENSEYDEAKNEQAYIEGKIVQIESMLKNARVIDEEDVSTETVSIGSKVRLRDLDTKEESVFTIVGSTEANPSELKISNESPIGSAIMNRKKGETVEVSVPDGVLRFKILKIGK